MLSGILISKLDITQEHHDMRHLNRNFHYELECVSHKCIWRKRMDYMFLIFAISRLYLHVSCTYLMDVIGKNENRHERDL